MAGGGRKIQGELSKLGFAVGLATVSRYLPKRPPDPGRRQRWMTFFRNHQDAIAAMDFCIVPTVSFQLLYVWFVIDHGRRRLIHFNVTKHPSARWVIGGNAVTTIPAVRGVRGDLVAIG